MKHPIAAGRIHLDPCCWPECHAEVVGRDIPLCERHYQRAGFAFMADFVQDPVPPSSADFKTPDVPDRSYLFARRDEALADQTQVYYVKIGDFIKIGYSQNLRQRLISLRVEDSAVLATEPGDRDLERMRHAEFADLRQGRRENFTPDERLLRHIDMIREHCGPPRITTYPKIAS